MKHKNKIHTSITLDRELLEWIDEEVKRKRFATRTHAIEYGIQKLKEEEV
jgi:Arc/MetJ-type ribon-helix-helix transcriptional regulator